MQKRQKLILVSFSCFWLLVGIVGWFYTQQGMSSSHEGAKIIRVGDHIPKDLKLHGLDGTTKLMGSFANKTVILNFWASWCGPCLSEMPELYKLYKNMHERGLEVLAMDMDEEPNVGPKILHNKVGPPPFSIYQGIDSDLYNSFEIAAIPFNVIIDKHGIVQFAEAGELDWSSEEMKKKVEALL